MYRDEVVVLIEKVVDAANGKYDGELTVSEFSQKLLQKWDRVRGTVKEMKTEDRRALSSDEIIQLMCQRDDCDFEKQHRKGATFFATSTLVVTQEVVDEFKDSYEIEQYLGCRFKAVGYWSDLDGIELTNAWVEKSKEVFVPEEVIPAHTVLLWTKVESVE